MMPTSIEDCVARYGPICAEPMGGLVWKQAPEWIKAWQVPDKIVMRNFKGGLVRWIYANKDIHENLTLAFNNLIQSGCHMELETFDGVFNVRWIRGMPGIPSFHSYGIAIDLNAKQNPLGSKGKWSENFLLAFELAGFYWGGNFKSRPDPMHWQLCAVPK